MPTVDLERSARGITEAFEDRNLASIAGVGVVSAVGASISAGLGSWGASLLGLGGNNSRAGLAATAGGAALVGVAAVALLGSKWGGPFAIGSMVVVGLALLAAVAPVTTMGGMDAQQILQSTKAASPVGSDRTRAAGGHTASGCTSCGNSHGAEAADDEDWSYTGTAFR